MEKRLDYIETVADVTTVDGMVRVEPRGLRFACVMPRRVAIATARALLRAIAQLEEADGSRQRVLPFRR